MILKIEIDERDNSIFAIKNYPKPGGGTIELACNTHAYTARLETADLVIRHISHKPGTGFMIKYSVMVNCADVGTSLVTVGEFLELICL